MKYLDYYAVLGIPRDASADVIKKAFRKLARQYHPDINKTSAAEARFKEINEAHEVLSDPEKRKRYDALGHNWKSGQDFTPPPDWGGFKGASSGPGGIRFEFGGEGGDFSDFFSTLFGDLGQSGGGRRGGSPFAGFGGGGGMPGGAFRPRGQDFEANLTISIEELVSREPKNLTLQVPVAQPNGTTTRQSKTFEVRIPPGATEGTRIRLSGQGHAGGNLYLNLHVAPHPLYRLKGHDLDMVLPIAPWEAVLGAKIRIPTLEGDASLAIRPGTQGATRLRLAGKGLPNRQGRRGDLYVTVRIAIPDHPTDREKELFEQLAQEAPFHPRPG